MNSQIDRTLYVQPGDNPVTAVSTQIAPINNPNGNNPGPFLNLTQKGGRMRRRRCRRGRRGGSALIQGALVPAVLLGMRQKLSRRRTARRGRR